jgi:hypothetical protein
VPTGTMSGPLADTVCGSSRSLRWVDVVGGV